MKRQIILILLAYLSVSISGLAFSNPENTKEEQSFLPQSFYKHFRGVVKKSAPGSTSTTDFPVRMNLRKIGKKITGHYYFENVGNYLSISGDIDDKGAFKMNDYDADFYMKGTFTGMFLTQSVAKGTWRDSDTDEEFAFEIREEYGSSLKFKTFVLEDKYHIKNDPNMPYIKVSLNYLHIDSTLGDESPLLNIRTILEKDFFGDYAEPNNPQKNINNKRDASISDYKNYIEKGFKNDPDKRDIYMWRVDFTSDIIYNEGKILSVMNNIDEDIGGVAGFGGLHYAVLDLETGRKLTLKDIFVPAFDVVLNAKLIDKVRAWHDIEKVEQMADAGFEMEMIVPNENFYVNSEGIGFYYNAYEIYELETRAFFPFKDIKSVLRKESPISHLFK